MTYFMPTRVFWGRGCLREEGGALRALGSRALIVTGKSSASNGALADVRAALAANGQTCAVFDGVSPNPDLPCVREGIARLRAEKCDFLVAVGGGSPMDAAKAIALLAVEERADGAVFAGGYGEKAYPMAHVPTTAGTGSEVTPYAILTNPSAGTKTSISSPALFPRFAFLDGRYTDGLPRAVSLHTAFDAFSHGVESLLSRAATPVSRMLARESLSVVYPRLPAAAGACTKEDRDALLYGSMLAGMAIAQSGTTAVHGMGYLLTYEYGVDHGRANALLLGETLRLAAEKHIPALADVCIACGEDAEHIAARLDALLGAREEIPRARLEAFAARALSNKNIARSAYAPTAEEILRIYLRSFPGK